MEQEYKALKSPERLHRFLEDTIGTYQANNSKATDEDILKYLQQITIPSDLQVFTSDTINWATIDILRVKNSPTSRSKKTRGITMPTEPAIDIVEIPSRSEIANTQKRTLPSDDTNAPHVKSLQL